MPEYLAHFTRIRSSDGESNSTEESSTNVPATPHAQSESAACSSNNVATGVTTKTSAGPTLVPAEKLLTPLGLIRQKQMLEIGRRTSDAKRKKAIVDPNDHDAGGPMVIARPKSSLARTPSESFLPETFSTPVQERRPRSLHLPTNSAVTRLSISPVINEQTSATASVPIQDIHIQQLATNLPLAQPAATPQQAASSAVIAPKSTTKQSRIPQWVPESVKKAALAASSTTSVHLGPIHENATPKSSIAPPKKLMSTVNSPARPIPEVPTQTTSVQPPTVTFNLTVNNTPAAAHASRTIHALQTSRSNGANANSNANTNSSPVNSNRVSSTIPSNKQTPNGPSNGTLLTDDEDDNQMDEAREAPQMWKEVANRKATPAVEPITRQRSEHTETNKSLRRQLFSNETNNQSRLIDERNKFDAAAQANEVVLVTSQRSNRSSARNFCETQSNQTDPNTTDRPMSMTYDKERPSLQNYTYDVVNPIVRNQPMQQNAATQNESVPQTETVESSGMPLDSVHSAIIVDEANGGSDSSATASSTSSNVENYLRIVSVQSLHPDRENIIHVEMNPQHNSTASKAKKLPEPTMTGVPTPTRHSRRLALVPLSPTNNHTIRPPSMSLATSTTTIVRDGETFSSLLPPTGFQDGPIITEHSPTVVRESIQQVSYHHLLVHGAKPGIRLNPIIPFQIISSQKNKSPIPLSLPNRTRPRPRRKNKPKASEAIGIDNFDDDDTPISLSQNGRRTLYTKGNSDCEDNGACDSSNAHQSKAQETQSEMNQIRSQVIAPSPQMSSTSPNEDITFERNSVSASSTLKSPEQAMTTMDSGRRQNLSDIIEEVQVATSAEPISVTANQIGPKRVRKMTKTKIVPKRGRNTKTTETVANDTAESTDGIRRSRRPKPANSQVLVSNAYELACQKVMSKRRMSPERTKEPEPAPNQKTNNRVATNKKRRIADKPKQVTKEAPENRTAVVAIKSKSGKKHAAVAIGAKPGQLFDEKHICQIVKDLGWFDILCNTKKVPTFVNQEGVYKIHTDRSESIKIGKNDAKPS